MQATGCGLEGIDFEVNDIDKGALIALVLCVECQYSMLCMKGDGFA